MTHVALLRGINVGGKNMLPMKDLAQMFADAGCANVRTYIQSGNVIFEAPGGAPGSPRAFERRLRSDSAFEIPVILRTSEQLLKTIRDNPFLTAGADQNALHVYFLADPPKASAICRIGSRRSAADAFHVLGREIYLHLPNGMGRSKLTNAYFDSKLSTICTARNWATVLKLSEMMEE